MNREEHLLTVLMEECSEVQKDICKSLRFGLSDAYKENKPLNRENITTELTDLIAVAQMLVEEGFIDDFMSKEEINNKKLKVEKFLKYSESVGKLK